MPAEQLTDALAELHRAERFRACHTAVDQVLRASATAADAAPGVLASVRATLGWPAAELWVAEDDANLRCAGRHLSERQGLEEVLTFAPIRGTGITGRVWATGRAIWVPDIADTANLRSPLERGRAAACLRAGLRAVLAVPVRDGGTTLGVLTCYAGAPERHEDLLTVLLDGVAARIGGFLALRRAEHLARQLTRAQDDFLALVSHEMRTPLTSIVASASLLAEEPGLDDEGRAVVATVQRNAVHLRGVVETLLDLAGLDAGHLALSIQRLNLTALVDEATGGDPRLVFAGHGPLWLMGDPGRLRQVIDHVLANALTYSPDGGQVRIGLTEDCGSAQLSVADDGSGIPASDRERVFDRFYRGGNARHQGIPGNGLGLSLARTVIRLHGGGIRLTGRRPHGTTVVIRLPLPGMP